MEDDIKPAFIFVFNTPIGHLKKLRFSKLYQLRSNIQEELEQAKLAEKWISGAIEAKREHQKRKKS